MCQAAGGVAAIVYNNAAGGFSGSLIASGTCSGGFSIPSFSLAQELAPQFQAATCGCTNITGTVGAVYPYEYLDGTSMACPHAATAALVWSMKPTCTNRNIRCALQRGALDLPPTGRDVNTGFGLVRAKAAVDFLGAGCTCV